jgi:hypothetical protein
MLGVVDFAELVDKELLGVGYRHCPTFLSLILIKQLLPIVVCAYSYLLRELPRISVSFREFQYHEVRMFVVM